jgi:hypothetical protein
MLAKIRPRTFCPLAFCKNVKVRLLKTTILSVVPYGCEKWSLIVRKEHKLRVFENRVLRRTYGPKRDGVTGGWKSCITKSCIICILHQV